MSYFYKRKRNNKLKSALLIVVLIFASIFIWYKISINNSLQSSYSEQISFKIKTGENAKIIGKNLEDKGLIKSNIAFYIYIRLNNLGEKIKAGIYKLDPSQNIKDIVSQITDINNGQLVLTIPEGYTIDNIDSLLVSENLINKNEFINCVKLCDFSEFMFLKNISNLEGYLFPDTYYVNAGDFNVEIFINLLLKTFEKKALPLYEKSNTDKNLNEIIIMSSIIEKEVRTDKDLSIVSGILWKRLDNGWMLGADATLLYGKNDLHISQEDLNENSPYNTRKIKGLPPTAISNPGLRSIEAALYPQTTDYWFYLTTLDTGEVIYSKTNEEHNMNKERYL